MSESRPHDTGRPLGHVAEWQATAVDYVAGLLSQADRKAVEAHLRDCGPCTEEIARQRSVLSLLQDTPSVDPPEIIEIQVLRAFSDMHGVEAGVEGDLLDDQGGGRVEGPTHASTRGLRVSDPVGWRRLSGYFARPTARKLIPALAVTLLLVVSLAGLSLLGSDDMSELAGGEATTAAALQAQAPSEAFSSEGAAARDDTALDESTKATGAGLSTTLSDRTADTATPETTSAGSSPGTTVAGSGGTAPQPTETTTGPGSGGPEVAPEGPASGIPVAFVTVTTGETTAGAGDLVQWTTGLTPLSGDLWLGAPTYAAFMPPQTLETMTEDLAAQGVRVSVSASPPPGTVPQTGSIAEAAFPTLEAQNDGETAPGVTADSRSGPADLVLVVLIAR